MFSPAVAPRVKERHEVAAGEIHTCKIRAFAEIAAMTGQREVVLVVASPMLPGNDVFDVVG